MNKSEIKGFNWLLKKGYTKKEIIFQARGTPDFLTADDRGYEVKFIHGRKTKMIYLTHGQYEKIISGDYEILAFYDDKNEPLIILPKELKEGFVKGVLVHIGAANDGKCQFLEHLNNSLAESQKAADIVVCTDFEKKSCPKTKLKYNVTPHCWRYKN